MNKAIERDLLSLLPSITLPLPHELTEVAQSLLSQSQSKASTLRQDEEIARGFVCANIACNRLKTKLNLPNIIVRPPVGPKTYKKVYAYLDSALTAGTPRKQQKNSIAPHSEPTTPSKSRLPSTTDTPSKTPARTPQAKTPGTAKSSTKRKRDENVEDDEIPSWVMPAIRSLCKAFKIPHVAPHVYVGVSSIVKAIREQQAEVANTPAKKRSRKLTNDTALSSVITSFNDTHIPALIVVVGFFTRTHLLGPPKSGEYATLRSQAVKIILKALPEEVQIDEETIVPMIEDLLREAENGWLDMEWYHNLPEPVVEPEETAMDVDDALHVDEGREDRLVQALEVPKRGFGSMMTDATDYLSDERRADYKKWKSSILKRIAQIEKQDKAKAIEV